MTTDVATVAKAWVVALTVAGLVLCWTLLARTPFPEAPAQPNATTTAPVANDPRLLALQRREQALQRRAAAVRRRHDLRWAAYRQALGQRQALIRAVQAQPAAPSFSTVTTSGGGAAPSAPPAATSTRSS